MIKIIDEGVLYRNPLPQLRSVHAYFPNILQLSDKEFFCAYSRGSAWVSVDIRGHKLRSVDGGKNWTDKGVIYDGSNIARYLVDYQNWVLIAPLLVMLISGWGARD